MKRLKFKIKSQPDYTTCGPTSLHALYSYWGHSIEFSKVLKEVSQFEEGGGTLGVILGTHALSQGFKVTIYNYNLHIFDPTWFDLTKENLIVKLESRKRKKKLPHKEKIALNSYIAFLQSGGQMKFRDLTTSLIRRLLKKDTPILTGLSATWLYQSEREDPVTNDYDDVAGDPAGHFVVIYGHDPKSRMVHIADPYKPNPINGTNYYKVTTERLINSILLGVMSYDGNLIVIEEGEK